MSLNLQSPRTVETGHRPQQRYPRALFSVPVRLRHLEVGGIRSSSGISLDISEGGHGAWRLAGGRTGRDRRLHRGVRTYRSGHCALHERRALRIRVCRTHSGGTAANRQLHCPRLNHGGMDTFRPKRPAQPRRPSLQCPIYRSRTASRKLPSSSRLAIRLRMANCSN